MADPRRSRNRKRKETEAPPGAPQAKREPTACPYCGEPSDERSRCCTEHASRPSHEFPWERFIDALTGAHTTEVDETVISVQYVRHELRYRAEREPLQYFRARPGWPNVPEALQALTAAASEAAQAAQKPEVATRLQEDPPPTAVLLFQAYAPGAGEKMHSLLVKLCRALTFRRLTAAEARPVKRPSKWASLNLCAQEAHALNMAGFTVTNDMRYAQIWTERGQTKAMETLRALISMEHKLTQARNTFKKMPETALAECPRLAAAAPGIFHGVEVGAELKAAIVRAAQHVGESMEAEARTLSEEVTKFAEAMCGVLRDLHDAFYPYPPK